MKEIGGFFELELDRKLEYHADAIKVNSGRNAIRLILKIIKPTKIFLPYYVCDSVLEPILDLKIDYEFYSIDQNFMPILNEKIESTDLVLYINYFGINDHNVKRLLKNYPNLVVDNTQSFFSTPLEGVHTIYSPRKFFGVADGGYLYSNVIKANYEHEQDVSYNRYEHLLKRIDLNAHESYGQFVSSENLLIGQPIKRMSKLTQSVLQSIEYGKVKEIRKTNFNYLHSNLYTINELNIDLSNVESPMVYPFLLSKEGLKSFLIERKIYVATYWKEVLDRVESNSIEYQFTRYLVPLPIDQRYNLEDMKSVVEIIWRYLK